MTLKRAVLQKKLVSSTRGQTENKTLQSYSQPLQSSRNFRFRYLSLKRSLVYPNGEDIYGGVFSLKINKSLVGFFLNTKTILPFVLCFMPVSVERHHLHSQFSRSFFISAPNGHIPNFQVHFKLQRKLLHHQRGKFHRPIEKPYVKIKLKVVIQLSRQLQNASMRKHFR